MKTLVAMLAAAFVFAMATVPGEAQVRRGQGFGGYCPAKTCANDGGNRAADARNCKASNCRGTTTGSGQSSPVGGNRG